MSRSTLTLVQSGQLETVGLIVESMDVSRSTFIFGTQCVITNWGSDCGVHGHEQVHFDFGTSVQFETVI